MNATTPRYWSYDESKTSARGGASGSPARRRHALDDRVEDVGDVHAGLRRDAHDLRRVVAEQVGDLDRGAVGIRLRQVDLVHDRHDLEPVLDREVRVRERLRLDALRRVDDEHGALARLQRARHLVREVHVTGRVDEVELVPLPRHAHGLRLDRDAALALELHRVEHLRAHVARGDGVGDLEDAVGERRLAVVDVRDDREVADLALVHGLPLAVPVLEVVGAAEHVVRLSRPDSDLVAVRVLGDSELVLRRGESRPATPSPVALRT